MKTKTTQKKTPKQAPKPAAAQKVGGKLVDGFQFGKVKGRMAIGVVRGNARDFVLLDDMVDFTLAHTAASDLQQVEDLGQLGLALCRASKKIAAYLRALEVNGKL